MTSAKTALVTGASSGMGKDFVKALIAEGMTVYATARRTDHMTDLSDLGAKSMKMDVTKEEDILSVVKTIEQSHGGVDLLVNNAGFALYGAVEDVSPEEARYQFDVNLFGLARLTQAVLPYMRENRSGKIINISSMAGKIYTPLGAWYHASKHALEGWSDSLRIELTPYGIDVIILEPGFIRTEFAERMLDSLKSRKKDSAYAHMTEKMIQATEQTFANGGGSNPQEITDLLIKAIRSDKPKTRYAGGSFAGRMLFARKWLSDRQFDKLILSMVK